MKKIILSCVLLCLISCNLSNKNTENESNAESEATDSLGRYLYLANSGVLHSDEHCYKMLLEKDEHGHSVVGYQFIDTMTVYDLDCLYCEHCFSDEKYEHFKRITIRNKNIHKLYESLRQEYSDIPETFEGFAHWFYNNSEDPYGNSKSLYNSINGSKSINYKSYNDFLKSINSENYSVDIEEYSE